MFPSPLLACTDGTRLIDHIQTANRSTPHVYHLLVVPRMTSICSTVLSHLGVLGSIDVQEYQLGLIPLENDVLSLESEDVWKKLCLVRFNH
jgi:hypothetical protein